MQFLFNFNHIFFYYLLLYDKYYILLLNSKLILAIYETTELAFFKNRKIYILFNFIKDNILD